MENKKLIIAHNWKNASLSAQTVALAEELSIKNKVIFISQQKLPSPSPLYINENLTVLKWPSQRPNSFKDFLFGYKVFKEFKPDITISHFTAQNIVIILSRMFGAKFTIGYYHTLLEQIDIDHKGGFLKFHFQRWKKRMLYKLISNIILESHYSSRDITGYYKIPLKKITIMHNTIIDHPEKNNCNDRIFAFLGRYDESKGIDILLSAVALVKKEIPEIHIRLAGGDLSHQQLKLIGDLKIEDAVENVGRLTYDQVFGYLSNCYALIVPSRIDNMPTVVMEAFSCATPVIGSDAGGIPEMINHENNGLLFTKADIPSLASQIIYLYKRPDKRNEFAENALKDFHDEFRIPHYVIKAISFLDTLER